MLMRQNDVAWLVGLELVGDEERETERKIYVSTKAAGQKEFFAAAEKGLRPGYVFVTRAADYRGEEIIEYRGQNGEREPYRIYRTYPRADEMIELYCEDRRGLHGD